MKAFLLNKIKNITRFGITGMLLLMLLGSAPLSHAATGGYTEQLSHTRLFGERLLWVGQTPPDETESQYLLNIIGDQQMNPETTATSLSNFIKTHPKSPWTPSLQCDLAKYDRNNGYFTLALNNWQAAWTTTSQEAGINEHLIADNTLVNWLQLLASLGRIDKMKELFDEIRGRQIEPVYSGLLKRSYLACGIMMKHPEIAYRCGTYALSTVAGVLYGTNYFRQIWEKSSPPTGFSMADLVKLSDANHLNMVAVERESGQELVTPSVLHWKQNHYAAIIAKKGEYYEVVDPTFQMTKWLSADAINAECSGQFLVVSNQVPTNWKKMNIAETSQIFGKGYPEGWNPVPTAPVGGPPGGGGGGGGARCGCSGGIPTAGMPDWTVTEPGCDLWLRDMPLDYQPSKGPRVSLKLLYSQEPSSAGNETTILDDPESAGDLFTFGQNWYSTWTSGLYPNSLNSAYITTVGVVTPGGGYLTYTNFDATALEFNTNTRMLMETNSGGTITGFRILHPSGAQDVYEEYFNNCFYLSKQMDPQTNASTFIYTNPNPNELLLSYLVDGDGKTNTLTYTNITLVYGYSPIYETNIFSNYVSQITDPYGRTVKFNYPGEGSDPLVIATYVAFNTELTNIVDPAGISSSFDYYDSLSIESGTLYGQLTQLTTPYGETTFFETNVGGTYYSSGNSVLTLVTEPDASHQMFFYVGDSFATANYSAVVPQVYTNPNYVPTNRPADGPGGNTLDNPDWTNSSANDQTEWGNSLYWGRQQFSQLSTNFLSTAPYWDPSQMTTNDFILPRLRHWNQAPGNIQGDSLSMERDFSPDGYTLGEMTWYDYPGKPDYYIQGSADTPILIIKVLPDGSDWYQISLLDQWNNATNVINTYSVNGVTMLRTNRYVYAANGQDLLMSIGPDGVTNSACGYDSNHNVLFMTNALGEVTSYIYNNNEQLISTTQPNGLVTTNVYGSNGYLAQQIAIGFSTNSYTYTNSMVYTHTDERGLTITNSWDGLLRLTNMAYPDGTAVSYIYSNLDMVKTVDRLGDPTSYAYDLIRQKTFETNALGNVTAYEYCQCGGLSEIIDALTNVTSLTHDYQGNLTQVYYPDGYTINNTYNLLHQLVSRSDSSGMTVSNWYDNQGLLIVSSNNVGLVKALVYDIDDRPTNSINANHVSVSMSYDNLYRLLNRSYPDGGVEKYGYTLDVSPPTSYTNQIGNVVHYGYDAMSRKTNEVYMGVTTNQFAYNGAGDLLKLTDGKNNATKWSYDSYGRVTNKVDATSSIILTYKYDPDNRLTNRWSAAMGNTVYSYDSVGNLTHVSYAASPAISLSYDVLNRLTTMVDAVGTTAYTYDQVGQLLSAGGIWPDDTVNYSYANRLRMGMSVLAPNASAWTQSYGFDVTRRLTNIGSPAGTFGYGYDSIQLQRVDELDLPDGNYITNTYDNVARETLTELINDRGTNLDSYNYTYNQDNQRTEVTRTEGDYVNYAYNNEGELTSAIGKAGGGVTNRWQEQFGYVYDAAGNLNEKTNNTLLQSFNVNNLNELTTVTNGGRLTVAGSTTSPATNVTVNTSNAVLYADVTFASTNQPWASGNNTYTAIAHDIYGRSSTNSLTVSLNGTESYTYDLNGNLLSDGTRSFAYDDENELIGVEVASVWSNNFVYDGKMRRRIERDYQWDAGTSGWLETNEVHFIYDGDVVVQERNANNLPTITYTRGNDLSGTLQGAGGIGGLLARTSNSQLLTAQPFASALYHSDGNGNVTCMIYTNGLTAAKYLYDPFGNTIAQYGLLANANSYRFSSKELCVNSGLYYYLYRFYDSNLQRWLNKDPMGDLAFENARFNMQLKLRVLFPPGESIMQTPDLYEFVGEDPTSNFDPLGLDFLDCLGCCIEQNDPLNLLAKGLLSGLGGPIPKSLVKAFGGRTTGFGGHSRFTGAPRLLQRYVGSASPFFIKWVGRIFSGAFIVYGDYMAGVEAACVGSCAGNPDGY